VTTIGTRVPSLLVKNTRVVSKREGAKVSLGGSNGRLWAVFASYKKTVLGESGDV
jgi:hypothetical protein